jgi:SAM-dependent methyltransferase
VARREDTIEGNSGPADRQSLKLDNPLLVRWEYASEERLKQRNYTYRSLIEGQSAEDVAFERVAAHSPRRLLEIGCGTGEFAERVQRELGAEVVAVDLSPRMVELAGSRGVDARVAEAQSLPFEDGEFDCAVANWVLYHVEQLDTAIAELARVLEPGGTLVAATTGDGNMKELWDLVGGTPTSDLSFGATNGADALRRHFARVESREANATVVFPNPGAMRDFVAATLTRAHLAANVPEFEGPFHAESRHVVFVAEKAA